MGNAKFNDLSQLIICLYYQIKILLVWMILISWRTYLHAGCCKEVELMQLKEKKKNVEKKIF